MYLERDERTARRWEKDEGLPIRRHRLIKRSSVYAYASELESWRTARKPKASGSHDRLNSVKGSLAIALGGLAVLLIVLFSWKDSWLDRQQPLVRADSLVIRQVGSRLEEAHLFERLSPNGRYISYVDRSNLALREVTTGSTRFVTTTGSQVGPTVFAHHSVISPESRWIAYSLYNSFSGGYEIRLVGLDGSRDRSLYKKKHDVIHPAAWSLDGQLLLARRIAPSRKSRTPNRDFVLIDIVTGSARVLKTSRTFWKPHRGFWRGSLSADNQFIAFDYPARTDSHRRDISLLSTDGKTERRIVEHPADDRVLGWIPNRSELLFRSDRLGTYDIFDVDVVGDRVEGPPRLIKQNVGKITPEGFSPDGAFYFSYAARTSTIEILSFDPIGRETRLQASQSILGNSRHPDWSPDGRHLAYVSTPVSPTDPHLYYETLRVKNIETGEDRELVTKRMFSIPRWSPDGREILVQADRALMRVDVDSGETTALLGRRQWDGSEIVGFSNDRTILYTDAMRWHLIRRDVESGEKTMLHEHREAMLFSTLSEDQQKVAFVTRVEDDSTTRLLSLSLPDGQVRELIRREKSKRIHSPISFPAWSPDANHLFFASVEGSTSSLWRTSTQDVSPERLWDSEARISNIAVHPGGKRLAVCLSRNRKEFWVMENYLPKKGIGPQSIDAH